MVALIEKLSSNREGFMTYDLGFTILPLLYRHEKRRADENGRIRTSDNADNEREGEMPRHLWADDVENDEGDDGCKRGVDGTHKGLGDALPDNRLKFLTVPRLARNAEVLPHAVKDDDRVVHGKAQNNEKRGDEKSVHFNTSVVSKNGKNAGGHEHIMKERYNGNDAVFPRGNRLGHLSEGKGDKQYDAENDERYRDERLPRRLAAKERSDGIKTLLNRFSGRY